MTVTYEAIAQRAFEIWEGEGRPEGRDREHWFTAEEELRKAALQAGEEANVRSGDPELFRPAEAQETQDQKQRRNPPRAENGSDRAQAARSKETPQARSRL
jgi:hypothetical protein